jgi:hypothetical protein
MTIKLAMEKFDLQIMLHDGSFADYKVQTERGAKTFEILKDEQNIASFEANVDGEWTLIDNPGNIDEDLQQRISKQLNGFRTI